MIEEGQKTLDFCLSGIDNIGEEKEFCLKDILKNGARSESKDMWTRF